MVVDCLASAQPISAYRGKRVVLTTHGASATAIVYSLAFAKRPVREVRDREVVVALGTLAASVVRGLTLRKGSV